MTWLPDHTFPTEGRAGPGKSCPGRGLEGCTKGCTGGGNPLFCDLEHRYWSDPVGKPVRRDDTSFPLL